MLYHKSNFPLTSNPNNTMNRETASIPRHLLHLHDTPQPLPIVAPPFHAAETTTSSRRSSFLFGFVPQQAAPSRIYSTAVLHTYTCSYILRKIERTTLVFRNRLF